MHIVLTNDKAAKDANTESSDTSTDEKREKGSVLIELFYDLMRNF